MRTRCGSSNCLVQRAAWGWDVPPTHTHFSGTWELLYPYSKLPSCTNFAGSRYLLSDQYLLLDRNAHFWVCLFSVVETHEKVRKRYLWPYGEEDSAVGAACLAAEADRCTLREPGLQDAKRYSSCGRGPCHVFLGSWNSLSKSRGGVLSECVISFWGA